MDPIERQLDRWVRAGLITAEQATGIRRFESPADDRSSRRSQIAEAVGYVGAALAVGALALLLEELWTALLVGGQLALAGLVTVLLGGGWWSLKARTEPALARLASALGTGTVAGAGWCTSIAVLDALAWNRDDAALAVAVVIAVVAIGMYVPRHRGLPQITAYVGIGFVVAALLEQAPLDLSSLWWGIVFWALGVAWALLGAGGWIQPGRVAELLGGATALFALQVNSFSPARTTLLVLAIVTAAVFVVVAVLADRTSALVVGAVGLFVFVPQLTFELFGNTIGAPATLLIVGLLLVVLALGIARVRQVVDESDGVERRRDTEVRS